MGVCARTLLVLIDLKQRLGIGILLVHLGPGVLGPGLGWPFGTPLASELGESLK